MIHARFGFVRPANPTRDAQLFVRRGEPLTHGGPYELQVSEIPSLPVLKVFLGVRVLAARLGATAVPEILFLYLAVWHVLQIARRNAPVAACLEFLQLGGSGLCLLSI